MSFVAIDLGTSFIKGGVLDLDEMRLDHVRRAPMPEPVPGLPRLCYELDPREVVAAVRGLLLQLLAQAPDCRGIVMCSQMHGLVLMDADGRPRSNAITWRDQRTLQSHPSGQGTYFERLAERITAAERRQLGNEVRPGLPIGTLFWLAEQGELPGSDVIPAALPDFVIATLCGSPPGMEYTNAAAHGALNLESRDWHHQLLAKLGLDGLAWPPLRDYTDVAGVWEGEGMALPCYTPVGDHQCALAGAFLGHDELSLNISTGSQVTLLTESLQSGDYQTRPFFDGRYLNTITHIPGGRALDLLVDLLSELAEAEGMVLQNPWGYIAQSAQAIEGTDLEVDLAFFPGPVGERGAIANIQQNNLTVGHLFRAAFQSMADNYHSCARRLSPAAPWQRLVFSGGLAQKLALLRQLIQQKFGVPYRLSASSEDTLLGLMVLVLVVDGQADSVAQATALLLRKQAAGWSP